MDLTGHWEDQVIQISTVFLDLFLPDLFTLSSVNLIETFIQHSTRFLCWRTGFKQLNEQSFQKLKVSFVQTFHILRCCFPRNFSILVLMFGSGASKNWRYYRCQFYLHDYERQWFWEWIYTHYIFMNMGLGACVLFTWMDRYTHPYGHFTHTKAKAKSSQPCETFSLIYFLHLLANSFSQSLEQSVT